MAETINVEIKARYPDPEKARQYLLQQGARFAGTDYQCDTYFNSTHGRLKLREGNIENNLIWYERANQAGPKTSAFHLSPVSDSATLKIILEKTLGIMKVVKKKREIYYLQHIKFHIDEVEPLGSFVEIEACNAGTAFTVEMLQAQCAHHMQQLEITPEQLLTHSYSDML